MKLNHAGIVVTDVVAARAFLETYFGLEGLGNSNPAMTHLQDGHGFILSLMRGEPESVHLGFIQDSEAQVDALYGRLSAAGFEVPPPTRSHGYGFYVTAPGGLILEVVC